MTRKARRLLPFASPQLELIAHVLLLQFHLEGTALHGDPVMQHAKKLRVSQYSSPAPVVSPAPPSIRPCLRPRLQWQGLGFRLLSRIWTLSRGRSFGLLHFTSPPSLSDSRRRMPAVSRRTCSRTQRQNWVALSDSIKLQQPFCSGQVAATMLRL